MAPQRQMGPIQTAIFVVFFVAFFLFISTNAIYKDTGDELAPIWITYFLTFIGLYWYSFSKTIPKWIFAILEIAAGTVSNYHQLTQQLAKESQYGYYDRLTFILAGIAVIAKGFQDLDEAPYKPWGKKPSIGIPTTSQSKISSGVPSPDSPTAEVITQERH